MSSIIYSFCAALPVTSMVTTMSFNTEILLNTLSRYPELNTIFKSIQIFRLKFTEKNKYNIITNPFSLECITQVGHST